jgi:hypothetical protein
LPRHLPQPQSGIRRIVPAVVFQLLGAPRRREDLAADLELDVLTLVQCQRKRPAAEGGTALLQPYLQTGGVSTLASAVIHKASAVVVRHVMVGGEWVIFDGVPTRADHQEVDRLYMDLVLSLTASIARAGRPAEHYRPCPE